MIERYVPATPEVFQLLSFAVQLLDEGRRVDGDDPVKSEHGWGGRAAGTRRWRFTCFPAKVEERWEFELDEDEVRLLGEDAGDLLDGTEIEVLAEPVADKKKAPRTLPPTRFAPLRGSTRFAIPEGGRSASIPEGGKKADPLGKRVLDRLVKLEAIELANRARTDAIAVTIERVAVAVIDDESLDDDERGGKLADAIAACAGVEELFATDEQLLALVRELDDV